MLDFGGSRTSADCQFLGGYAFTGLTDYNPKGVRRLRRGRAVVRFLLDCGATNHGVNDQNLLFSMSGEKRRLGGVCGATEVDVCDLKTLRMGGNDVLCMGALYRKDLSLNILSENRLLDGGWEFDKVKRFMYHKDRPQSRVPITRARGLQWIDVEVPDYGRAISVADLAEEEMFFGEEFLGSSGEIDPERPRVKFPRWLLEHVRNGHFPLLPPGSCKACDLTRRQRRAVRRRKMDSEEQLRGVVATDLCGPLQASGTGMKYMQLFVDLSNREIVPYFLRQKKAQNTKGNLRQYILLRGIPRVLKCDNGTEFKGAFTQELCDRGSGDHVEKFSRVYTCSERRCRGGESYCYTGRRVQLEGVRVSNRALALGLFIRLRDVEQDEQAGAGR